MSAIMSLTSQNGVLGEAGQAGAVIMNQFQFLGNVTPAMERAGLCVFETYFETVPASCLVAWVYSAMQNERESGSLLADRLEIDLTPHIATRKGNN